MLHDTATTLYSILGFALEVGACTYVTRWAHSLRRDRGSRWARLLTAAAALTVFAAVWGAFASPRAEHPLHGPGRAVFELAWYATGLAAFVCFRRGVRKAPAGRRASEVWPVSDR